MIKELIENIKNIEKSMEKNTLKIMCKGIKFSYMIAVISCLALMFYVLKPITYVILEIGIKLFKTSLIYAICFIICGVFVNQIKKDI